MQYPFARAILSIVAAFLAVPLVLHAQRHDIQISTPDRGYRMLPGAKVQTADSTHGVAAVVWGTTELTAQNKPQVGLYVQLVRNGAALGTPKRLGNSGAQFSGDARVVPLDEDFLIIYNDRTWGSSRTFSQFLDARTGMLGEPQRLSYSDFSTKHNRKDITVLGGKSEGWRVFWYGSTANYLFTVLIDSLGTAAGGAVVVNTFQSEILSYHFLPDLLLIESADSAYATCIVDARNGRFDSTLIPPMRYPFHLGRDTSLLVLNDTALELHRSLSGPADSVRWIPLSTWGARASQAMVRRDNQGRISIYLVIGSPGNEAQKRLSSCRTVRLRLESLRGSIRADTLFIDSVYTRYSDGSAPSAYIRQAGNDNAGQIAVNFVSPGMSSGGWIYVTLDSSGAIHSSAVPVVLNPHSTTEMHPTRVANDSISMVIIPFPGSVGLSVPVIPVVHISPAITVLAGNILCTWWEMDTVVVDVQAQWNIADDSTQARTRYPQPPRSGQGVQGTIIAKTETDDNNIVPLPGDAGLSYNYIFDGIIKTLQGRSPPITARILSSRFALARPGAKGWVTAETVIKEETHVTPSFDNATVTGKIMGYDPDSSQIIALLTGRYFGISRTESWLRGYNRNGTKWELVTPWHVKETSRIIPMGAACYILLDSLKGYVVAGNQPVDTFDLSLGSRIRPLYTALYGPYFARTSWDAADTTMFHVEMFDTFGRLVHAAHQRQREPGEDYMLVQSLEDSTMVILFGGSRGVRAMVLGKDLAVIANDMLVSETTGHVTRPNGAWSGDTLFTVWEDYRQDARRIYGTFRALPHEGVAAVTGPASPGDNPAARSHTGTLLLQPNPATGMITITCNPEDQDGTVFEITNMLGEPALRRTLFQGSTQRQSMQIDISALPAGVYVASLRSGGVVRTQTLVKN